jgi:hypothetical protein
MSSAKTNKSVSFNLNPYSDQRYDNQMNSKSIGRLTAKITNKLPIKQVSLEISDISLESNIILLNVLKLFPGYVIKPFKEAIYLGIMLDGLRHGLGIMKYRNGR